jgi:hypothetical protein
LTLIFLPPFGKELPSADSPNAGSECTRIKLGDRR